MLLGNYGRDHQVGDSSGFDGSQTPSSYHHPVVSVPPPPPPPPGGVVVIPGAGEVPSKQQQPGGAGDQMLAACQRAAAAGAQERRLKPHSDQVLKCPRCDSMNTKFCYYNNYSLTQPRHFCKNCKRYWTKGGALRNVPVGGGCRKNKRVKQRQSDHHHHHQQQQQHQHPQQAPHGVPPGVAALPHSSGSDEVTNASNGGLTSDGASSSGMEFVSGAATSATSGGLFDVPKGSNGISLGFDRIDVPRIFPGGAGAAGSNNHHHHHHHHQQQQHHHHHHHPPPPPPPISLNWAAAAHMALGSSQAYDAGGLLGLNLSAGIKQEPMHATDMNAMFDPGLGMSSSHVAEGLATYAPMESFGLNGAAGEVLWRFQQPPKLVSLLEEGNDPESRPLLELETGGGSGGGGGENNNKMKQQQQQKGKGSRESMQVSSDYEQGDTSSSPEWQPTSDGFFDSGGGETAYWSNGAAGWSSATELHSYGPHSQATTGNHQML